MTTIMDYIFLRGRERASQQLGSVYNEESER